MTTSISIRIIGRGGQGIKSAAHILGTTAFLTGLYVQDQPLYGAERRGAPITAFIRISKYPILERGHLSRPSLLVIADDSLLNDSTIDLLQDTAKDTIVLVNTDRTVEQICSKWHIDNNNHNIVAVALDNLVYPIVNKLAIIGIAIVGAACKVLGYEFDTLKQALEVELANIRVAGEELEKDVHIAKLAYDSVKYYHQVSYEHKANGSNIREPLYVNLEYHNPKISSCTILSPGNTGG